jgi:hypothetical protein
MSIRFAGRRVLGPFSSYDRAGVCNRRSLQVGTHRDSSRLAGVAFLLFASTGHALATDFYVSKAGSDANSGRSPEKAWRTLSRANKVALSAGDRIFLRGGDTFAGTLYFGPAERGTAANPIVVTSYGRGRAAIYAGPANAVGAYNTAGISLSNLVLVGSSWRTSAGSGVYFFMDLQSTTLDTIIIENVAASGFKNGIEIGAWKGNSGFKNIRILHSVTHDNRENGITIWGDSSGSHSGYSHHNVLIRYCTSYRNSGPHSVGNGIVISNVNGGVIERSITHSNGLRNQTSGGPVGMWAWRSNDIVVQHNESYSNHSNVGGDDGNGFNLDGGVTNSVLQYNYSHDNDGGGFVLAQYTDARPFHGNVVRYNISENDARRNYYSAIYAWSATDYEIRDSSIYNNTVYVAPTPSGLPVGIAVVSRTQNLRIRNNIIVTKGGLTLLAIEAGQSEMTVQGNAYWSMGSRFRIKWGGQYYKSLNDFRSTGQERVSGANAGYTGNPRLVNPGSGGTVGNPGKLEMLQAYKLRTTSPLIAKGLDIKNLFGEPVGRRDYYGTPVPSGTKFEIGAYEMFRD